MVQPLWKIILHFLKKLNIKFSCDPAIPLIDIYPRELKTGTQARICTQMSIVALLTIAKRYKQP